MEVSIPRSKVSGAVLPYSNVYCYIGFMHIALSVNEQFQEDSQIADAIRCKEK